jgi:antitoxin (DNA-binding transcriptional repressor) of toxin-antitoxin stability system
MTRIFNMHDAKSNLSKLVELVEAGEVVQIARNGVPIVELSQVQGAARPKFGSFKPFDLWISEDFDDPMPEWEEAMALSDAQLTKDLEGASRAKRSA